MKTTYRLRTKHRSGDREVSVIGLPMDRRLREQNALRTWAQCKRPGHWRKPVAGCKDCPTYTATSRPELTPGRHGAGASPLFEFLERDR